jgi:hypothetical protein
MSTESVLIDELQHNANASGNQVLERRLADLSVWYHMNKSRIPRDNLASRQAFLEKALWIQIEMNALLLERIRKLNAKSGLWLPSGMLMDGADVKQFA